MRFYEITRSIMIISKSMTPPNFSNKAFNKIFTAEIFNNVKAGWLLNYEDVHVELLNK